MSGFRRNGRKPIKCAVKISHQDLGDFFVETRDVSATGIFVHSSDLPGSIAIGDTLKAQLYSEERKASNTQLVVVRTTSDGVGLAFK